MLIHYYPAVLSVVAANKVTNDDIFQSLLVIRVLFNSNYSYHYYWPA